MGRISESRLDRFGNSPSSTQIEVFSPEFCLNLYNNQKKCIDGEKKALDGAL